MSTPSPSQWKVLPIDEAHTSHTGDKEVYLRLVHPSSGCQLLVPRGPLRSAETQAVVAEMIVTALNGAG